MNIFELSNNLLSKLNDLKVNSPSLHLVLGSSFSDIFSEQSFKAQWEEKAQITFSEAGFKGSTAPGHRGVFHYLQNKKTKSTITCQVGRLHGYEGTTPQDAIAPVLAHRLLGTKKFILTNAAGALTKKFKVGSLMIIKDHVNLTGLNPLVGANPVNSEGMHLGQRFPDMSQAYDLELSNKLENYFKKSDLQVNHGVYLGLLGPSFETPAEIKLFSQWGLHAVGMSTVWETIALRHGGARVAGVSLISNLGCGLSDEPLNHDEILKICKTPTQKMLQCLLNFAENEGASDE
ncbi:MAG: purine-nucleoside phosphorylase [Oligoflexia bacterium]|nr:purine-nucleoside phosphorylase [Oligoflexia bacterium]